MPTLEWIGKDKVVNQKVEKDGLENAGRNGTKMKTPRDKTKPTCERKPSIPMYLFLQYSFGCIAFP